MRYDRDAAIVTLLVLVVTCATILFLKLAEPTGGMIDLLFPRVPAGNPMKTTSTSYKKDCLSCDVPAQGTDWIYTAGYPALK